MGDVAEVPRKRKKFLLQSLALSEGKSLNVQVLLLERCEVGRHGMVEGRELETLPQGSNTQGVVTNVYSL